VINVNAVASHLPSSKAATELAPLVEQLAKRADANRDGKVTSAEFMEFLTKLTSSLDEDAKSGGNLASSNASALSWLGGTQAQAPAGGANAGVPAAAAARALVAALAKER
jgi:hypothetical protein